MKYPVKGAAFKIYNNIYYVMMDDGSFKKIERTSIHGKMGASMTHKFLELPENKPERKRRSHDIITFVMFSNTAFHTNKDGLNNAPVKKDFFNDYN